MKVKHLVTICGILLGGLAVTGGASAVVTYSDSADVQFTFSSTLSMTLSGDAFTISNLMPDTSDLSNAVTATVNTNSPFGYLLTATVGNSTYNTPNLVSSGGQTFQMISADAESLSSGTWGYTDDDGETYKRLSNVSSRELKRTTAPGSSDTVIKIGAKAADSQYPGTYNNVVNFTAVSNIGTYTITINGSNTSSVSPVSGSYAEGDHLTISATCSDGYTFANWGKLHDYGVIANPNSATTTYTVGSNANTVTAYCVSSGS